MKKIFITPIFFLIFFTFSSIAVSKIVKFSLSDMIEKSEIIIIGKVVKIEETNEKRKEFSFSKATIKVEKILKGNQNTKSIDVYFLPAIVENEPNFFLNDKSIFFIYKYQNRYTLVQGGAGKIDINNGNVKNINMLEQIYNQKLDNFVNKIKNTLENIKTKDIDGNELIINLVNKDSPFTYPVLVLRGRVADIFTFYKPEWVSGLTCFVKYNGKKPLPSEVFFSEYDENGKPISKRIRLIYPELNPGESGYATFNVKGTASKIIIWAEGDGPYKDPY